MTDEEAEKEAAVIKYKTRGRFAKVEKRKEGPHKANAKCTEQQEHFAQLFVLTGNATQAYHKAYNIDLDKGDHPRHSKAHQVLRHPNVMARIKELQKIMADLAMAKFKVDATKVIETLAACAFYDPADYFEWDQDEVKIVSSNHLTPAQRLAITGVVQKKGQTRSIEVKMADRLMALEKLGKHLGLFNDGLTVNHKHSWVEGAEQKLADRFRTLIERRRDNVIDVVAEPGGSEQSSTQVGILGTSGSAGAGE